MSNNKVTLSDQHPVALLTKQPEPVLTARTVRSENAAALSVQDSEDSLILIVDDDPADLKLTSRLARRLGYTVTVTGNPTDFMAYLDRAHYELVITDFVMPAMDGYQLAERIKHKYPGTKVIIMTGSNRDAVSFLVDETGIVDGLLLKPFTLKTLEETIGLVLRLPRAKLKR